MNVYPTRLLLAAALFCTLFSQAQTWTGNGIPVITMINGAQDQISLCCTKVHDGVIYTWRDSRTVAVSQDIYAQKLTPCGAVAPGWPAGGLIICSATNNQQFPQIVPDNSDGAFITWQDTRAGDWDIYAQHVLGSGTVDPAWPANGAAICNIAGSNQQNPHICIDGSGGAIISWDDNRSGNWDIWAQRITSTASQLWGTNGSVVITENGTQNYNAIAPDSVGGAFFVWEDTHTGSNSIDIYAMRLNNLGQPFSAGWGTTSTGLLINNLSTSQKYPGVVNTGGQKAAFFFADPNGAGENIKAMILTGTGTVTPGWTYPNGTIVGYAITQSGNPGTATYPVGAADCSGGIFIAYQSNYSSSDHDALSVHFSSAGVQLQFEYTAFNTDIEKNDVITPDGTGGAVNTWQDQWPPAIVWNRKFGGAAYIASGIQSAACDNPNITAMGGVWYTVWEDARTGTLGADDVYGISSSALGPPPILNSTITQTYNNYSCAVATQNRTICFGTPVTFNCPIPAGLFNTYTFKDGATTLQSSSSNSYTNSTLSIGTHTITVVSSTAAGCSTAPSNQIIITVSAGPSMSLTSQTNVACNGNSTGSATINATGGTPAYTYNWTPSGGTGVIANNLIAGSYTCTVTDANGCTQTQTVSITEPTAISGSTTTVPATCGNSNGSATVVASGGTPGYTYSWTPAGGTGATTTPLASGNYSCTNTDANGCTHITPATINNSGGPTVTLASSSNVSCNGGSNGSASVNATGGTGPYTYAWTPSGGASAAASSLPANTYTCTVTDANGCVQSQIITITEPTLLTSSLTSSVDILCNGGSNGSAVVSASGGTGAYTYAWSPSGGSAATASSLTAGPYTCTITDANGCTSTQSVTLTQPSSFTVTATQANISCNSGNNGSATVNVSGATPAYTYAWAPSGGSAATASSLAANSYVCTITDANGCTATQSFNITEPTALSNSSSSTNEICGNANGSATVNPSGGTSPYNYSWSSGGSAATENNLAAGSYTCIITDANGCGVNATVTVSATAGPTVGIASQTGTSCNGGSNATATLSVSGGTPSYTYAWTPSGGTGITGTGLSAGIYTATVTDANGCTQTQTISITEPTAVAASSSHVDATCGTNNGSATVVASGGTGAYTYSWAPSGGTGVTTTPVGAGNYTCTITDANGCTGTAIEPVNNIGGPTVALTSQVNVTCNGGSNGSAVMNASGGNPGYTYLWSPFGGTAATATSLTAGTFSCQVTDNSGCIQTATVLITEPTAISASSTFNPATCGNPNGDATVTASGGTGVLTYSWAPAGGSSATTIPVAAGNYTCTITDANGCTTTSSVAITNSGSPSLALSTSGNVSCFGGSNGTATMSASSGTSPYTYAWSSGGSAATESGLVAGTYTCTVTDANGCTQSETVSITEPVAISTTTSSNPSTCSQPNGSASVTVNGGTGPYTYNWSSGGSTATESNLFAGTYTVLITDANGCSHIDSASIAPSNGPTLALSSTTNELCFGGSTGAATMTASNGTGPYSYSWSSGGSATTESGLVAGTYTCTVTDASGCTQTETVSITEPTQITSTPTSTNVSCFNGSNGSATVTANGGTPAYTYNWTPSGGTAATANNLGANSYTCTITDANGCSTTQAFTITAPTAINGTIASSAGCSVNGGSASISASGGTGPYSFAWSPSGGNSATASSLVNGTYTCTITDAGGCTQTATTTITNNTPPTVVVSPDVTIIIGSSTALSASGATSYAWTPTAGLSCTGCANPNASPSSTTIYCVTGTDNNGCTDSACVTVTVNTDCGEVFVPTAFSPNGDVVNDELCVFGVQCMKTFDFVIYDRWGEKVFESMDPAKCWDGKFHDKPLDSDVFVYYLTGTLVNGDPVEQKGNISLVR